MPVLATCHQGGVRAAFFMGARRLAATLGLALGAAAWAEAPAAVAAPPPRMAEPAEADPTWHALLHLRAGRPQIDDPSFLLSAGHFSPGAELEALRTALRGPDAQTTACRFPGRTIWLQSRGEAAGVTLDACPAWIEFNRRAPAQRLGLVFASENLASPSSMMGHVYLTLHGQREDGVEVAHAVSFYTDTDTWNLPRLLVESMVIGKAGRFALSPADENARRYVLDEGRSLWTFTLDLKPDRLRLLQAHLLELREARITYFFQDHNCATLLEDLLRLAAPGHPAWRDDTWSTPRQVLRQVREAGLVTEVQVLTPPAWRVRTLRPLLDADAVAVVRDRTLARTIPFDESDAGLDARSRLLRIELAQAWDAQRTAAGEIDEGARLHHQRRLEEARRRYTAGLTLSADPGQDPSISPPEAQWTLSLGREGGMGLARLGWQAASHAVRDDNRSRANESTLRLFATTVRWNEADRRVWLERFTLYEVESLLPRDPLAGGWSGRFGIAWAAQDQLRETPRRVPLIDSALGATWRLGPDVDVWLMAGAGLTWRDGPVLQARPAAGVVVREIGDMKSVLRWQRVTRPQGRGPAATTWSLEQMKYLTPGWSVGARLARVTQAGMEARREGELFLVRLF